MLTLIALAGALSALREADARVAAVAWRLQTANVALCRDAVALPGFSVETLDQYATTERAEAAAEFGLGDLPQISSVVPGSAAARAGLQQGDAIVAVDGRPMPRAVADKPSYARTALVDAALADALARPPVTLTLANRTATFSGDRGCASNVQLVPGGRLDAVADGHYVQISGVMYEFVANDSELAFILGHELAHNVVPEARRAGRASQQRKAELAADRAAIGMMARAGYDVGAVLPLMERLRRKNRLSWLDGSHPGWSVRLAAARAAVAEQYPIRRDSE
jgi:membrane-associated protease RseP (regulator of RpoE activity)